MDNYITFFPVGNGDMTLIQTSEDLKILVDCNMKKSAEEETNSDFNCMEYLQNNLPKENDKSYVDAMFLTHSDQDHCRGVKDYFNLCSPEDFDGDKIIISELVVPARLLIDEDLGNDDAKAIREEAERRLGLYGDDISMLMGNRLKIIGYSKELKDYTNIIVPAGEVIFEINGKDLVDTEIFVLRPVKRDIDNEDADVNEVTASFKFAFKEEDDEYIAIIGGDMTCDTWKEVIEYNPDLQFDILLAPHHCSWHAISNEDKKDGNADEVISDFLEKSKERAFIVVSSKEIIRNDDNPPSYRAKNEYERHINEGRFQCTANYPDTEKPQPYTLQITKQGVSEYALDSFNSNVKKQYNAYVPKSYGMRG